MKKIIYSILTATVVLSSCGEGETKETTSEHNSEQTADSTSTEVTHNEMILPKGWEETSNESFTYLAIRDSVSGADWANFSEKLGGNYMTLVTYMMKNNIEQAGQPLTQWFTFDEMGTSVYTAGIPVVEGTTAGDGMEIITIEAGSAYKYVHTGPYEGTESAHSSINQFMYGSGNLPTGACWEIYVTDPGMEPDTSKWVTEIWYPIGE